MYIDICIYMEITPSSSTSLSVFRDEETRPRKASGTCAGPQRVGTELGHKPRIWLESQFGTSFPRYLTCSPMIISSATHDVAGERCFVMVSAECLIEHGELR